MPFYENALVTCSQEVATGVARAKLSRKSLEHILNRPTSNRRTRRAWPTCTRMKAKR